MSHSVQSCKRILVKYGGASLADHERISKAVEAIAKEVKKGTQVAVVVSAIGKTTDSLLSLANSSSRGAIDKMRLDDILSMGERTSARLFTAALRARGVEANYLDPSDEDWPIVTDDTHLSANPILELCDNEIRRHVLPLIERGVVPVIPGFVGKTIHGNVSTLGRGGSDTTAFILARALDVNEAVLVTDSDGIMSVDPKIIPGARRLTKIDVNTLVQLADSGGKFIHRKALRYKDPSTNVRVIDYRHGDLSSEGTLITGALSLESNVEFSSPLRAVSIVVAGRCLYEKPTIIQELSEKARSHSTLLALSASRTSITLYALENGGLVPLLKEIHEAILNHKQTLAMSIRRDLAFIETSGVAQEDMSSIVSRISEGLRSNGMNLFSISTTASSITFLVSWNEREKALNLIKESVGGN